MAIDVGSAVGYLDLDITGFLKGLKSAQDEASKNTDSITTQIGSKLQTAGDKMTSAGSALTKGVTLPLVAVGTAGLKVATDFEKSMSQVKAISGATGEDFGKLRDKAIDLGASTAFSSKEVADAMTEMAKAGWDTQQIMDGMAGVLDAAAASGEQLGTVSTIVADAITGFGLAAADSTRVADLLTQAANAGTIDISDLGESFKYVAPVAGSLGFSIEDVTTALAAMSTAGIKGSQAGTSLRTIFTNMAKPTDNMAAAMQDLGVSLDDGHGRMLSMKEILDQMRTGFGNLMISNEDYNETLAQMDSDLAKGNISHKEYIKQLEEITNKTFGAEEAEKAKAAATLAGKEGLSGLLSIMNMTQEEYDALSESMYNSKGVAEETATVMQDNLGSKVEQLGGSLESLAIRLGDYVIPMIQEWVIKLTEMVDKFTNLDPEIQKTILKFAAIAAAAGPILVGLGKITSATGTLVTVFGKVPGLLGGLKTSFTLFGDAVKLSGAGFPALASQSSLLFKAFTLLTGPIGVIIATLAVLGLAFKQLWETNEEFRNKMIAIWDGVKKSVEMFINAVLVRINELGFNFTSITDVMKAVWDGFVNFLAPVFEIAFGVIANILDGVLKGLIGLLDVFIGVFTGDWEKVWSGLSTIVSAGLEMVKNIFITIYTAINDATGGALDSLVNWFATLPERIGTWIDTTAQRISDWATNVAEKAKETGENFLNNIIEFFDQLPYNIGYYTTLAFITIGQWTLDMVNKAMEMGKNFIDSVVLFFKELPGNIKTFIQNAYTNTVLWASDMKNKATEMGRDFIANVVEFFRTLPDKAKEWFENTIVKAKEWTQSMKEEGGTSIKEMIAAFLEGAKEIPTKMAEVGKWIVNGVWKGIQDAKDKFIRDVKDFFGDIVEGAKDALDINSPSKVMADQVGKWMPLGVASGFKDALPTAISMMQKSLTNGVDTLEAGDIGIGLLDSSRTLITGLKDVYGEFMSWLSDMKVNLEDVSYGIVKTISDVNEMYKEYNGTGVGYVPTAGFQTTTNNKPVNDNIVEDTNKTGDTFNFYSPNPISEVEAARQFRKVKQELAEGFS